jgi:hypothetical protein
MIAVSPRGRGPARPHSIRATRPTLERLEGRLLLYATTGGHWTYPAEVTYSIVPDGTSIGGTPSNLQQVLGTKSGWQQQIQQAAAAWEAVAGINLVQVPDDGSPIGTAGNQQGDPRFGDIRIGGMPQSGGQLGFAYAPPPFNGGTNAGDIFFNTTQSWQTNGTTYDLMTVAIHEFGHALGMAHSAIPKAVMYASYTGTKQTLTTDDTSGIQSVYGVRSPDAFDDAASNNSSKAATVITSYVNSSSQIALAGLDITTSSDVDWYKVTVPSTTSGTMTVAMQATNLSSLVPGLTVYNANLQAPGNSTVTNTGGTITISTPGVKATQVWYIKAMAGVAGPMGIGAYGLLVNFGSGPQAAIAPPNTTVAAQPDLNPTTTPEGEGWIINGHFIPANPDKPNGQGADNGLSRITVGPLGGFGDALEAGDLHARGHDAGSARSAGESHPFMVPEQGWVSPTGDGLSAAPLTPFVAIIGAGSGRVRAAARSADRVPSDRADTARHRVIDAALGRSGSDGRLSSTASPSRPQEVNHPRGRRAIAGPGLET